MNRFGGISMKSKVYFTRELTPEAAVKMYNALGVELPGRAP